MLTVSDSCTKFKSIYYVLKFLQLDQSYLTSLNRYFKRFGLEQRTQKFNVSMNTIATKETVRKSEIRNIPSHSSGFSEVDLSDDENILSANSKGKIRRKKRK